MPYWRMHDVGCIQSLPKTKRPVRRDASELKFGPGNTRARYRRILRFASWHLTVTWWFELFLPRIGLRSIAERSRERRMRRFARRFHVLAVDLGGLMIKVGQFMSSRLDVLPPEITDELKGLQDEVPAVPFAAIRSLAEAELGGPLAQYFASVEETPVAAASLGQVHRARLLPVAAAELGLTQVVVKVQRPGIADIVDVDLAALRKVGGWLSHVRLVSNRANAPALVEEFAQTSLEEIDYLHEAANLERFATEFADNPRVRVPAVVWERSSRRVLTLQDVTAIKIADTKGLLAAGIDPAHVALEFATVMFEQLFSNGFFHADPHPGNLFITPLDGDAGGDAAQQWALTFIDFGMMGQVPAGTRSGFRRLLIAAAARDGRGIVAAMDELGVLVRTADAVELERAMTALFARFGGMGFAELRDVDPRDFRDFAAEFGDLVRTLPFQLPENFLLIVRAMSLTSGVCSALDEKFNLWDSVEPFAAKLLREERGNVVQDVAKEALDAAGTFLRLPKRLDGVLAKMADGSLQVSNARLERHTAQLHRTTQRLGSFVVFAAVLIAGSLLRSNDAVLGNVLLIGSAVPLLHGLWAGRRS